MKRRAGILMHPTSFPGPFGTGDLGPEAYKFIDWMAEAKQSLWQILPLNPTVEGDSPYYSYSALGGNTDLISPEMLMTDGLVTGEELTRLKEEAGIIAKTEPLPGLRRAKMREIKNMLYEKVYTRLSGASSPSGNCDSDTCKKFQEEQKEEAIQTFRNYFEKFKKENSSWLDDFAFFVAMKESTCQKPWWEWPEGIARHEVDELRKVSLNLEKRTDYFKFVQFLFFYQWKKLRDYAHSKGIEIIGDVPIFVALDSVDVWVNRHYFFLDENLRPTVVSGVPPDYFSAEGQLWGTPLYNWDEMQKDGYRWWKERLRILFSLVDIVRLDHFRGFEAYWEVPAGEKTAVNGRWVPGPGSKFFNEILKEFGKLPVIAEDLGIITPEVRALKDEFQLPGMKILQFAFDGDPENAYLPHNHIENCIVYTGTHDNDTTLGWLNSLDETAINRIAEYTGFTCPPPRKEDLVFHLIRIAYMSVARSVIIPAQDILLLGSEARMNTPGTVVNNWSWRMEPGSLCSENARKLARMVDIYSRWPD